MIALVVMTDGRRDCIEQTIPAFDAKVSGHITFRAIHDDSGDSSYRHWLHKRFPEFTIWSGPRQGFGGAVQSAWRHLRNRDERFIFHLEDDFVFNKAADLGDLADVLDAEPHLVQLAFRRQPWNADELVAGGIVEQHPAAYTDRIDDAGRAWLEHRLFFTTNPSLYRRRLLVDHRWPSGAHSEGRFTHRLLEDPEVRFGFWGTRGSGEWVQHIGHERVGTGY